MVIKSLSTHKLAQFKKNYSLFSSGLFWTVCNSDLRRERKLLKSNITQNQDNLRQISS